MKNLKAVLCVALILLSSQTGMCDSRCVSLNGQWQIWFDTSAQWQKEKVFLQPADLSQIPRYSPTVGWEEMLKQGEPMPVPSTWEEKYPDYDGVAWYWRQLEIPQEYQGKVLRLKFWAVRHRAEVYLNQKLIGYSLEGSTPFEVDISDAVKYGRKNLLAVRVTDPGGGDNWRDYNPIAFGEVNLPDSHNFGGIWQDVELLVTGPLYVEDVYIQPQQDLKTVRIQTTLQNKGPDLRGKLIFQVTAYGQKNSETIIEYEEEVVFPANEQRIVENSIVIPKPRLWSPESPFLYNLKVTVKQAEKVIDTCSTRFGMRFFTEKNGDLYLNGKRIFFKCCISWGYYPKTIAYPSRELAEKEIKTAKLLGLNALSAHRTCATPVLLDMADTLGLMIHQEPGGAPRRGHRKPRNPAEEFERELFLQKFQRLVRRDRNHPSLIWWNCANERQVNADNLSDYIDRMMRMVHEEDPSRLLTYSSESGFIPMLRPYENQYAVLMDVHTVLNKPTVWRDRLYLEHLHFSPPSADMALFNGESRCFTALSDLPKVVEQYAPVIPKSDGAAVKDWLELLSRNFNRLGLKKDFNDPGNFCRLTGAVQGTGFARLAEAMRLNPRIDGFALNGWHCHHILGTSGMVNMFRTAKFAPEILADAMKPLHLAITPLPSVGYSDEEISIKITLINETDVSGTYELTVQITDPDEKKIFEDRKKVDLKPGCESFVQPLAEYLWPSYHKGFNGKSGYYHIQAKLENKGKAIVHGKRDILIQSIEDLRLPEAKIYYFDGQNAISHYLDKRQTFWMRWEEKFAHFYTKDIVFLLSRYTKNEYVGKRLPRVLEMVRKGDATLVWMEQDMKYADEMLEILRKQGVLAADAQPLEYPRKAWLGGWEFCKKHPIFDGLPNPAVFDWQYGEVFAPWGIRNFPGETIAGLCQAPPVMATIVGVIPHGEGKIIFCSLNLMELLGRNPVADRIFAQLIKFAVPSEKPPLAESHLSNKQKQ